MRRSMTLWVQLGFLAVFLILVTWVAFLRAPAQPQQARAADAKSRCEARGAWWDDIDKVCAVPMSISSITHRPSPPPPHQ